MSAKIDFGSPRMLEVNQDVFGQPFIQPKSIQPRNGPPDNEPALINDEALRNASANFNQVRAEQTEIIKQHTEAIRIAEEKITRARNNFARASGML